MRSIFVVFSVNVRAPKGTFKYSNSISQSMDRHRFKVKSLPAEKLEQFTKKFEKGDFANEEEDPLQKELQEHKVKSVLNKFAEVQESKEDKKTRVKRLKWLKAQKEAKEPAAEPESDKVIIEQKETIEQEEKPKPVSKQNKAETHAIHQYRASLKDAKHESRYGPLKRGFLFGLGVLIFFLLIFIVLFSISVIMGISIPELVMKII